MGNCFATENNQTITVSSIDKGKNSQMVSSSREKKVHKLGSKSSFNMSDFMGIKKSDSIENFYKIDVVIGRGAFGEVVKAQHLFSNDVRAIKMIDKRKLGKHSILMQL